MSCLGKKDSLNSLVGPPGFTILAYHLYRLTQTFPFFSDASCVLHPDKAQLDRRKTGEFGPVILFPCDSTLRGVIDAR